MYKNLDVSVNQGFKWDVPAFFSQGIWTTPTESSRTDKGWCGKGLVDDSGTDETRERDGGGSGRGDGRRELVVHDLPLS